MAAVAEPPNSSTTRDVIIPHPELPPISADDDIPRSENDKKREEYQKKFVGYRVFSKWMASDTGVFTLRRFGTLNARVALSLQDGLVQLEEELEGLDVALTMNVSGPIHNGTFREEPDPRRRHLVEEVIPGKLTEYNNFINSYSQLLSRPEIYHNDLETVRNWMSHENHHKGAISDPEAAFIDYPDDLIVVHPKSRSFFRNLLDWTQLLQIPVMRQFFERRPRDHEIINVNYEGCTGRTMFQHDKKVERFSDLIIALIGLAMLIGPLWALAYIDGSKARLGCITGFIFLFFVLVAAATNGRVVDALVATAAYSAVLMVFLQVGVVI